MILDGISYAVDYNFIEMYFCSVKHKRTAVWPYIHCNFTGFVTENWKKLAKTSIFMVILRNFTVEEQNFTVVPAFLLWGKKTLLWRPSTVKQPMEIPATLAYI